MHSGPGLYLKNLNVRSHMLRCYGHQVLKGLRSACNECLQSLQKSLGPDWNMLSKEQKSDFQQKKLLPVSQSHLLRNLTEEFFEDNTTFTYPLTMELLLDGAKYTNSDANQMYNTHQLQQLIKAQENNFCLNFQLNQVVGEARRLNNYKLWVSDTPVDHLEIDEEFLPKLVVAAWCAVQLYTVYYYHNMASLWLDESKPRQKNKNKATMKELADDEASDTESDDDSLRWILNTDSDLASSASSSTRPKKLKLSDIPCQEIVNERVEWIFPTDSTIISRVDCDGAHNDQRGGYSSVIRRVVGDKVEVIRATAGCSTVPVSSLYHEIEGALCGWQQAVNQGLKDIEVALDCTKAVLEIRRGLAVKRQICKHRGKSRKMKGLINKIMKLSLELNYWDVFHMYRGANGVADLLAHLLTVPGDEQVYSQKDIDNLEHLGDIRKVLVTDAARHPYHPSGSRY